MTTPQTPGEVALAHEIWALAQLAPGEGIEDAVARIAAVLAPGSPSSAVGERPYPVFPKPDYVVHMHGEAEDIRMFTEDKVRALIAADRLAAISAPAAEQQPAQRPDEICRNVARQLQADGKVEDAAGAWACFDAIGWNAMTAAPVVQAAEQQAGVPGDYPVLDDRASYPASFVRKAIDDALAHRAQQAGAGLGGWIDVRDRLPTHNYSVLGVVVDGPLVVAGDPEDRLRDVVSYEPSRGWLQFTGDDDSTVVTVTHWQDLSELP